MKRCIVTVLPVQIPPQGSPADTQLFCRGCLVAPAGIQHVVHDVPVHFIQGLAGIQAEWGGMGDWQPGISRGSIRVLFGGRRGCLGREGKSGKQDIFPPDYLLYGLSADIGPFCPYDGFFQNPLELGSVVGIVVLL